MPNRNVHMLIGAGAGFGVSLLISKIKEEKIGVAEYASATICGIIGSLIPDKIDTPMHPNHRSIAHGTLPVGFVIYKSIKIIDQGALPSWLRYAIYGFVAGYALHLLADLFTPKGIPILA
jgi:membrane-bound metal-dependent hydrolase YbcI (DUF457 family)